MAMQFDGMNDVMKEKLKELAEHREMIVEENTALFGSGDGSSFDELTNAVKELTEANDELPNLKSSSVHKQGDIITLDDGSRYEVTDRGWKKLEDDE